MPSKIFTFSILGISTVVTLFAAMFLFHQPVLRQQIVSNTLKLIPNNFQILGYELFTREMSSNVDNSFYQFSAKDADGKEVPMDKYKGKVVLVVNVASQCGFTDSNYKQLKGLLDEYKSKGLEVAAFPCNQFGSQEPGCELDIKNFVNDKYQFEPDLYSKINVNGNDAHPIYKYLKKEQGGTLGIDMIKWNFTKFLINRKGKPIERYAPTTEPNKIKPDIEKALAETA